MISRVRGTLVAQESERIEVATPGGLTYEILVPLTVAEQLPIVGEQVELRTLYIVREDLAILYGFLESVERELFELLLTVNKVGGSLALKLLSAYSAPRLIRALTSRDVPALTQVSGVGKKIAERLALELSDKADKLDVPQAGSDGAPAEGAQAAVQALTALGMSFQEAEQAVRAVLEDEEGQPSTDELVRRALAQ